MLVLLAIVIVVAGFAIRLNPLLVVVIAALAAGVLAAWSGGAHDAASLLAALTRAVETLGREFNKDRYVTALWLILPLIGLLEREGLQERARALMSRIRAATPGRLLVVYLLVRQLTAAIGLTTICGHAQTVRPLIAPMAEGAAETRWGPLSDKVRFRLRAWVAATDNVGVFFGEDIFFAVGSILLITATMGSSGHPVQPLALSMWAIPTAVIAFVVQTIRLRGLDRRLERELKPGDETGR
jgi:uncharacterized membrane protein